MLSNDCSLGIDIGSTTVKIAVLDAGHHLVFGDYMRHHAQIRQTLYKLLIDAHDRLGNITVHPVITGSGGLSLAKRLQIPFVQEVVAEAAAIVKSVRG